MFHVDDSDYCRLLSGEEWPRVSRRLLDPVEPMHAALAMVSEQASGPVHLIYLDPPGRRAIQDLFVADDVRGGDVDCTMIERV